MSHILCPLDVENLQSLGLVSPVSPAGTRRIHKRRLNSSSDEENAAIPLDISFNSPEGHDAFATIPDVLVSYATLRYIGFSEEMAKELWERWTNWPPYPVLQEPDVDEGYGGMSFDDFFTGVFEQENIDVSEDNDQLWFSCLSSLGISSDVQQAIMDPHFKYLRLSNSCAFWARDTVVMRYAGLEDIQRASREREMSLRRASGRSGNPSGSGQHGRPRSVSNLQHYTAPGVSHHQVSTSAQAIAARNAPGHTILYNAVDQARIHHLLDANGTLSDIRSIISHPPTDFSGRHSVFYFTADYKVAEFLAAYTKRRSKCEAVSIVRISVPNSAIEQLGPTEIHRLFWPSSDWKELVWLSRREQKLPSRLMKYQEATLIIGTIACGANRVYHKMDSFEEVDEQCVRKVEGFENGMTNAVQFAFSPQEGEDFLMEHCANSVSVHPYTRAHLERWMVEAGIETD